ncbi:MAG: PIG-L family deacetylase [Alkalinema sp. RL_2_19]|nr:PIG-L family deacetylase [Alkalinema sp. RL_2_19]
MFTLGSNPSAPKPRRILCLGAHSDDIEIGCGGTILQLIEDDPELQFHWVVFGATGARQAEAIASAHSFLREAKHKTVQVEGFKDGFFPYVGAEIKAAFEQLKQTVSPDLILTHYRQDLHQDHQVVANLTWNTFRNHPILEYEIPKYDGDMGSPNVFMPLTTSIQQQKIDHLMQHFSTQSNKHWFTAETFRAILRLRGIESNHQYAEAFYGRKLVLSI